MHNHIRTYSRKCISKQRGCKKSQTPVFPATSATYINKGRQDDSKRTQELPQNAIVPPVSFILGRLRTFGRWQGLWKHEQGQQQIDQLTNHGDPKYAGDFPAYALFCNVAKVTYEEGTNDGRQTETDVEDTGKTRENVCA
jgi:hypothetical protein